MKKRVVLCALLIIALCLSVPAPVFAEDNSKIDISVSLNADGSADITQVWTSETYDGTEMYLPVNLDGLTLSNFTVSDENGPYTDDGEWDVDRSFDQKAGKYGIVETSDGVELCWGLTEYGKKTYTFSYTIGGIMGLYTDYDGFNFQFVNDNMALFPADVTLTISMADGTPLSIENSGIWAFGFSGQINFTDEGKVYAYSETPLDYDRYMNIMMRFQKGMFTGGNSYSHSFTELENEAKEGSDYIEEVKRTPEEQAEYDRYMEKQQRKRAFFEKLAMIAVFLLLLASGAGIIAVIYFIARNIADRKKLYNEADYFRDTPNGGDTDESYWIAQTFALDNDESSIIGATILKLINTGCLRPVIEQETTFFGGEKEVVNLAIGGSPDEALATETKLYRLMKAAAGENGVLEERELEKYIKRNPERLQSVITSAESRGKRIFKIKKGFIKKDSTVIRNLSERGRSEVKQMMGLKKFLLDFSLIAERGINESLLWQDYLVYATLLGIADKVMEQFKKVYPENLKQYEVYERNVIIATTYNRSMYTTMQRNSGSSGGGWSGGGGGSSSFGGGGGFSGGGSGGGAR